MAGGGGPKKVDHSITGQRVIVQIDSLDVLPTEVLYNTIWEYSVVYRRYVHVYIHILDGRTGGHIYIYVVNF